MERGSLSKRIWGAICALGLGIKVAFAFVGLALLSVFAYGRRQRDLGAAREKARERTNELDTAAKAGDASVQDYIERRYKEDTK